ncbi:MAG: hypothetical protein FJ035_01480 [Chloroflexi bacterium]|nr:hypothetical protein [Chloroflexota bacterium]
MEAAARLAQRLLDEARGTIETRYPQLTDALAISSSEALIPAGDLAGGLEIAKQSTQLRPGVLRAEGSLDEALRAEERWLADPRLPQASRDTAHIPLATIPVFRAEFEACDDVLPRYAHGGNFLWNIVRAWRSLLVGDLDAAVAALPERTQAGGVPYVVAQVELSHVYLLWLAGFHDRARSAYDGWLDAVTASGTRGLRAGASFGPADVGTSTALSHLLDATAVTLASPTERDALRVIVQEQPGWCAARMIWWPLCMQRVYGDWAVALDMLDDAERLHRDALAWCERERCPIEAGRYHRGLADVAERRGQHAETMQHLDAAGELFARHGAKLYPDQVIAKKQILKA